MDPIVTPIVIVLGKYALDKGVELAKEVGPKALETAKEMFAVALDRLRRNSEGKFVADRFEENPETYQKPLEHEIVKAVQADPDLATQLKALLAQYEEAAREHAAATGTTYQATVVGSGAIAQDHSVAAGAGGVAVGRDVHGGIHIPGRGEEKDENEKE
jgi:hypothetical protein